MTERMRKVRSDNGGSHSRWRFPKGVVIRRYAKDGTFEKEFRSIEDALRISEEDGLKVTYIGINKCVLGVYETHGGKRWRCNYGKGTGLLEMGKVVSAYDMAMEFMAKCNGEGFDVYKVTAMNISTGEVVEREFYADVDKNLHL